MILLYINIIYYNRLLILIIIFLLLDIFRIHQEYILIDKELELFKNTNKLILYELKSNYLLLNNISKDIAIINNKIRLFRISSKSAIF
jgi:hypothetical protein